MDDEVEALLTAYRLKEVSRWGSVGERRESTAEHVYSALLLARYFLPRAGVALDEAKVMAMLLYHDLVEVEAGDAFVLDDAAAAREVTRREHQACRSLRRRLPSPLAEELADLWQEFEAGVTPEARFCRAVDRLDPMLHSILRPADWQQRPIPEDAFRRQKEEALGEFPALQALYDKLLAEARRRGYFRDPAPAASDTSSR